ncbi:MAG: hypothetical protein LBJ38_00245, partial [Oscillospiraceae bacterium]|nr:hypothetical protein [Oscillospiraceae bacterium]
LADLQAADFALCVLQNGWHVHLPQTYRNLGATDLPTEWPLQSSVDTYGIRTFGFQPFNGDSFAYTDMDGTRQSHWSVTSWAQTADYWNDAPFLLCELSRPGAGKMPPEGTTITEYEEMREIEVPPLLYARGLLTILRQTAGCWAPKSHAEAEADFMAALGFYQNWRVLYKQNIARNLALAGGEIISGHSMSNDPVTVRAAGNTIAFSLPMMFTPNWQVRQGQTPLNLLFFILSGCVGPLLPGFVTEQQLPSQWAQQELAPL